MMTKPSPGEFCWTNLLTANVQAAKEFYGQVFGWEYIESPSENTNVIIIKQGDKEMGGIVEIPAEKQDEIPPHWMNYILVDDIDGIVQKARDHGAIIRREVTTVEGKGRYAVIADPTGAHFSLWQPLNPA